MTTSAVTARQTSERTGYDHLTSVLSEHATLARDDPRRATLRAELILGFWPVARNIARKYSGRHGEPVEDLEQVASLGLVLAVDRFDPARGVEFLSFAVPTITGEVLRHFRDRTAPIRLPRPLRALQGQIHDAAAELTQHHGRAARPSEIATHLGVDRGSVLRALAAGGAGYTTSLDEPTREDERSSITRSRYEAVLGWVDPQYDLVEYRVNLAPLLAELPEREFRILTLRFVDGLTQTEIGQQVGISQMHVSRLLTRTIRLLRRRLLPT